jgi:hypothetical protein
LTISLLDVTQHSRVAKALISARQMVQSDIIGLNKHLHGAAKLLTVTIKSGNLPLLSPLQSRILCLCQEGPARKWGEKHPFQSTFGAVLLSASCSMCGRNLPFNWMRTRLSPPLPVTVVTLEKMSIADMMPSPNSSAHMA